MRVSLLENFLSKELNSDVTIKDVIFGFNEIIIYELNVGNPTRATITHAFEIERISIKVPFINLFRKKIPIKRIDLYHPQLGIEFYDKEAEETNWKAFLNELPKKKDKEFTIDFLALYWIEFEAKDYQGNKFIVWPIPYLEFTHLDKPLDIGDLIRFIYKNITDNIHSKNPLAEKLKQPSK